MKTLIVCGVILSVVAGSSTAMAGSKWWQWGHPQAQTRHGFERVDMQHKFESSRYEQPLQWTSLDKEPFLDAKKLHNAGILGEYYIDRHHVSIVEVGANFYHLSGADKRRAIKSTLATLDELYVDRLEKQYVDQHMKRTVGIESDFYYMTDNDKFNKLKSFNIEYHRKTKGVELVRVVDSKTHEVIGEYGPEGFFMQ